MNKKQIEILNDYFLHAALHTMTLEEQCLRKACAKDLSIRELHVIEAVTVLQGQHKNTMAEIARYLHLSPASLTTAVNTLVRKEYLNREYSPADRRVIYVEATEKGAQANQKYLDFIRNMIWYVSRDIDEGTSDILLEAILKLSEFLEAGGEPEGELSQADQL